MEGRSHPYRGLEAPRSLCSRKEALISDTARYRHLVRGLVIAYFLHFVRLKPKVVRSVAGEGPVGSGREE